MGERETIHAAAESMRVSHEENGWTIAKHYFVVEVVLRKHHNI